MGTKVAGGGVAARIVREPEILAGYRHDVSYLEGHPEGVLRARDEAEIVAIVEWARATGTALLPVGARTSTTGASVAQAGVIIDQQPMLRPPVIDTAARTVRVGAAANLGELRRAVAAEGLFLPTDPTSVDDCTVGGAVACNASGPGTFRYGSMARYVHAVRLVDGAGVARALRRRRVEKSAMGPPALQEAVDWIVGSEGHFGAITEVELNLLPSPGRPWGLFMGFATRTDLLSGVRALRGLRPPAVGVGAAVRAVEWLDAACCELLRPHAGRLGLPETPGGGLYVEVEGADDAAREAALTAAAEALEAAGGQLAEAQVLQTADALAHFAALRHRVPDTLNGRGARAAATAGGGKLSTDWSAPLDAIDELLRWGEDALERAGLTEVFAYGHIGNGHPHINVIAADAAQRVAALAVLEAQLERVVAAGGVPTSEHGIGKIKAPLVARYLPHGFVAAFRGIKAAFDPDSLFARGNILVD